MSPVWRGKSRRQFPLRGWVLTGLAWSLGKVATPWLIPSMFPEGLLCAMPGARHWGNSPEPSSHSRQFMAGAHSQNHAHRQGMCTHNHDKANEKHKVS